VPAYVIVETIVHDPEVYSEYMAAAPATIEAFGGRFVVRGGELETLEGDWMPARVVVVEFPDLDTVRRWYDSELYRHAKSLREGVADLKMVAVEGV
jgi:uncharacterized protein (DUF1330 family)